MKKIIVLIMLLVFFACSSEKEKEIIYFQAVEQMPEPIGGIKGIQSKINYPELAKKAGVMGRVAVRTYVDSLGNVTKTEVIKGIGSGCDEEAERAIMLTKFVPGKQSGKETNVQVVVPVLFRLEVLENEQNAKLIKENGYFERVDIMPEPIGGMRAIQEKITYPELAKKAGVQGNVAVKAFVDIDGNVTKLELLKGIGSGCDEEAMKAIKQTKFKPGKQKGHLVNVQVVVPINFKLE